MKMGGGIFKYHCLVITLKGSWVFTDPLLYRAVCVVSVVLFGLSPLGFCSVFVELAAACSALLGVSLFTTCWRSDSWEAASVEWDTTILSMGSLAVLSVTII